MKNRLNTSYRPGTTVTATFFLDVRCDRQSTAGLWTWPQYRILLSQQATMPSDPTTTRPTTQAISPFFIVSSVEQTIAFYRDKLGFELTFQQPEQNPFFAIIVRNGAQIFLKSEKDIAPLPNSKRHPSLRWDAYVYAPDPDALALKFAERFADKDAAFSAPLQDTHDGLRGFEIRDPNGYVLFFGRPRSAVQTKNDAVPNDALPETLSKPTLLAAEPQLFVTDVAASCDFYTKKLGFAVAFTHGDPPFYAQVFRDGASLNLRHLDEPAINPDLQAREHLLSASITVDDANSLFLEFQAAGVAFHQTLKTEPWGARTFIVRDPDGNLILFAG
jgi:catechol 2,3-dioxygenase-like lactoylglutathione lyase family enzyme